MAEEPGRDMRQRLSLLRGLELRYAISDMWLPGRCFRFENGFRRRFGKELFKIEEHPVALGKARRIFSNTWPSESEGEVSISSGSISPAPAPPAPGACASGAVRVTDLLRSMLSSLEWDKGTASAGQLRLGAEPDERAQRDEHKLARACARCWLFLRSWPCHSTGRAEFCIQAALVAVAPMRGAFTRAIMLHIVGSR